MTNFCTEIRSSGDYLEKIILIDKRKRNINMTYNLEDNYCSENKTSFYEAYFVKIRFQFYFLRTFSFLVDMHTSYNKNTLTCIRLCQSCFHAQLQKLKFG